MIQKTHYFIDITYLCISHHRLFVAPGLQHKAGIVPPATVYNRSEDNQQH